MNLRSIAFVLPFALPSLNVRDRQHWSKRSKIKDQTGLEILAAIGGPRYLPRPPFAYCRIHVVRYSSGMLDTDNAYASCKGLLDALCVSSRTHPTGIGFIVDDNPRVCELKVTQESAAQGAGMTAVRIEELAEPLMPEPPKKARPRTFRKRPSARAIAISNRFQMR